MKIVSIFHEDLEESARLYARQTPGVRILERGDIPAYAPRSNGSRPVLCAVVLPKGTKGAFDKLMDETEKAR